MKPEDRDGRLSRDLAIGALGLFLIVAAMLGGLAALIVRALVTL